ncbi:hypothetical protein [Demequina salsinemoris]|uniref:hypothetical protein n=1 Tax=Demequina salsinemoris TaxID=577470 RepID=UPI0007842961|nr:hypothetical protein [Demequina salsinemoris]
MADALSTTVNAGPTLSRRRIIQTAAWAAPAIVVATAVPAAATSPDTAPNLALSYYSGNLGNNSSATNGAKAATTATIVRSNDTYDGVYAINEIRISFTATKWVSGTQDAVAVGTGWVLDTASTSFPTLGVDGAPGVLVLKPNTASGIITVAKGSSVSADWELPKYEDYTSVVVNGTATPTSGTAASISTTLAYTK